MKRLNLAKRVMMDDRTVWLGVGPYCVKFSLTTHRFLVPIWVDRSSDGTVCVRVSVWVWESGKLRWPWGLSHNAPSSSFFLPHQIFHHPTIPRQLAVGCPSSLFSFYIPLFFSIGASCQLTTVTREITSGLMRRSLWCTGPAPIQHML